MNESDGSGVKSAERALTILELFSRPGRALTFTQVAEQLGYPRSSLHGLLRTLTDRGWLQLDPVTRRFSLGLRVWEAAMAYDPAMQLVRSTRAVVQRLHGDLDTTVFVSILDGGDAVAVNVAGEVAARRTGAHRCTSGRLLLAHLDPVQVEQRVGARLDGGADEFRSSLAQVRDQGWAEGEAEPGRDRSIAVPLRDRSGEVVAALGVVAPPARLEGEGRDQALEALRRAAEALSGELEAVGA